MVVVGVQHRTFHHLVHVFHVVTGFHHVLVVEGVVHPVVQVMQMQLARHQHHHNHGSAPREETPQGFKPTLQHRRPSALRGVLQRVEEQGRQRHAEVKEPVDQQVGPPTLVVVARVGQETADQGNCANGHQHLGDELESSFKLEFHDQLFIAMAPSAADSTTLPASSNSGISPPCWSTLMYSITNQRSFCDNWDACEPMRPFP